jgi:hypothetical protein
MAPLWYELGFYVPEDRILHGHPHESSNFRNFLLGFSSSVIFVVSFTAQVLTSSLQNEGKRINVTHLHNFEITSLRSHNYVLCSLQVRAVMDISIGLFDEYDFLA